MRAFLFVVLLCSGAGGTIAHAQSQRSRGAVVPPPGPVGPAAASPLLTRSSTRHEVRRLGYGGTFTIYGAPVGSVTIEAWPRNEVDITAEIELKANTEDELARLAAVNNFSLEADGPRLTLLTTGTHDRKFMKRAAKDFPKALLAQPWKIDYRIRVPAIIDLEIYTGRGALTITNVDGAVSLNAGESDAIFTLGGGDFVSTIASGSVTLRVPARGWRGRGASMRLARGTLTLELPANFSGDIDASILRAGRIENNHPAVVTREDNSPTTERQLRARAGAGGAMLSFEVGDGVIRITTAASNK